MGFTCGSLLNPAPGRMTIPNYENYESLGRESDDHGINHLPTGDSMGIYPGEHFYKTCGKPYMETWKENHLQIV